MSNVRHQAPIESTNPIKQVLSNVYFNLFDLICLNLFFIIGCIPVLTIPNAINSLTKVNLDIITNNNTKPLKNFWRTYFTFNKRWLFSSFIYTMVLTVLSYGLLIYLSTNTSSIFFWALCGFDIVAIILLIMIGFYLFPLLIFSELDPRTVWKHALGMVVVEIKSTIVIFICVLFFWIVCFKFFFNTWIVFLLIAFSLSNFFITFFSRQSLAKYFLQFQLDPINEQ